VPDEVAALVTEGAPAVPVRRELVAVVQVVGEGLRDVARERLRQRREPRGKGDAGLLRVALEGVERGLDAEVVERLVELRVALQQVAAEGPRAGVEAPSRVRAACAGSAIERSWRSDAPSSARTASDSSERRATTRSPAAMVVSAWGS